MSAQVCPLYATLIHHDLGGAIIQFLPDGAKCILARVNRTLRECVSAIDNRSLVLDDLAYLTMYEGLFDWAKRNGLLCSERLANLACVIGCVEYLHWIEHQQDLIELDLRKGVIRAALNDHYPVVRFLVHYSKDEPRRMTDDAIDSIADDLFYDAIMNGATTVADYLHTELNEICIPASSYLLDAIRTTDYEAIDRLIPYSDIGMLDDLPMAYAADDEIVRAYDYAIRCATA